MPTPTLNQITTLILAGGLGTRLRTVLADRPKPLAEVNGRPFLAYQLDQLLDAGVRDVVFCTGHLGDQLEHTFGSDYHGIQLRYSRESMPLGTAGALRLALPLLNSRLTLVLNGDSFLEANLPPLLTLQQQQNADIAMLLAHVPDTQRYGRVRLLPDNTVASFEEKGGHSGEGLINAGIYLMKADVLEALPVNQSISLERDVLPKYAGRSLVGLHSTGRFIDIGTPETYAAASEFFSHWRSH